MNNLFYLKQALKITYREFLNALRIFRAEPSYSNAKRLSEILDRRATLKDLYIDELEENLNLTKNNKTS